MMTWVELYRSHRDMRDRVGCDASRSVRTLLANIAKNLPNTFDRGIASRFTYEKRARWNGSIKQLTRPHDVARPNRSAA